MVASQLVGYVGVGHEMTVLAGDGSPYLAHQVVSQSLPLHGLFG